VLKNLSGPAVFAAIVLGLAVFLVPDGPWRLVAALAALAAILGWAVFEPRFRAALEAEQRHRREYFTDRELRDIIVFGRNPKEK
jgi:hypothetical protein